ncbi:MAG: pyridoxal-phosphate dependent enzyme [Erysipelotrichales bacterium]
MIRKTSLIKNEKFSSYTQNNIYMKTENLQTTGSFKIRSLYKIMKEYKKQNIKKVVSASTGNHGISLAYLSKHFGIECDIILPIATPYNILKTIKDYDANIILEGNNFLETSNFASKVELKKDWILLDLKDNLEASLEYGDIVKEIVSDLKKVDIILVPVGSGSLLNGILHFIETNKLDIKVYAVEPYYSAPLALSIKNNRLSKVENSHTLAKAIDNDSISNTFFDYIKDKVDGVIKVSDEELVDCFLEVVEENKMIVENAGLLSLAGSKYLEEKNKNVVCILSGGNLDITNIAAVLEYGLKNKGRIFTIKTKLSDKPGELIKIATIIAKEEGNIIGMKHNQLAAISRQESVELILSIESLGLWHKYKICNEIEAKGYQLEHLDEHLGSGYYE